MGQKLAQIEKEPAAVERAEAFAILGRMLTYARREAIALDRPAAAQMIDEAITELFRSPSFDAFPPRNAAEKASARKH
jgi:hypothetical protein